MTNVRNELGSIVPLAIKDKIWRDEYVELGGLLESVPIQRNDSAMVLTGSGSTLQPQRKTPGIMSIEQWTSAFLVYVSIYAEKHLKRARELFKYMDTVRTAARFGGYGWRTL